MKTICTLCPHHCALDNGQTGLCRARSNRNGSIVCENYGKVTALALDPIEKKPLRRFFPGSMILSVGSYGCNLRCPFCQNYAISMADGNTETLFLPPEALVRKASELIAQGNIGLAYTYNEPLVGYEYVRDCAVLAHRHRLKNVLVTNGYLCAQPFEMLLPLIDAVNIDLKGFTNAFYDWVNGDLRTVKNSIVRATADCHVEVTTLIIPDKNDDPAQMHSLAAWLASVDPEIPLHVSRFFPRFHVQDRAATPTETMEALTGIARTYLHYVYTGNC